MELIKCIFSLSQVDQHGHSPIAIIDISAGFASLLSHVDQQDAITIMVFKTCLDGFFAGPRRSTRFCSNYANL